MRLKFSMCLTANNVADSIADNTAFSIPRVALSSISSEIFLKNIRDRERQLLLLD